MSPIKRAILTGGENRRSCSDLGFMDHWLIESANFFMKEIIANRMEILSVI